MSIEDGKHQFLGTEMIKRVLDAVEYVDVWGYDHFLDKKEAALLENVFKSISKFGTSTATTTKQLAFLNEVVDKVEIQERVTNIERDRARRDELAKSPFDDAEPDDEVMQ